MSFARVKEILIVAMNAYTDKHGGEAADLTIHDTPAKPPFPPLDTGAYTAAELRNGVARGKQLIQDEVVGQNPPRGGEANLVVALRVGFPPRIRQMPSGGPFLTEAEILEIEQWIDSGCPEGEAGV